MPPAADLEVIVLLRTDVETAVNPNLMLVIDKQFLETTFYGGQQVTWQLQIEGQTLNQKRIRRLMWLMRLMPIYQKLDTSTAWK